jgi:beta-N-acetylhexosaminidase
VVHRSRSRGRSRQSGPFWRRTGIAGILSVVVAVALAMSLGCATAGQATPSGGGSPPPARRGDTPRATGVRGSALASLSPAQLAGQRIIYAFAGPKPPAALLSAIREGEAAGVILFGPNVTSPTQVRALIGQLQRANAASPVRAPLLILTDQEGGQVRRLPGAPVLSERQIGQSRSGVVLAQQAGTGAGHNLAGAGINVNLAPVVDVFRRHGNFIDEFGRSYSSNPNAVARLAGAFVQAQQRTGVAATAKHFPGLGAASQSQNTDLRLVTLNLSRATLRSVDEAPYRAAISAGVKLVMTSWAVYPALDRSNPAGLSSAVIGGELRGRLGYRGVTISDTIESGALARYGSLGQRGVLAARAGADLIICSAIDPRANQPAIGSAVLAGIATALSDGRLGKPAAEQAAARVLALREHP